MDNFDRAILSLIYKKNGITKKLTDKTELQAKLKNDYDIALSKFNEAKEDTKLQRLCLNQILNADKLIKERKRQFINHIPKMIMQSIVVGLISFGATILGDAIFWGLNGFLIHYKIGTLIAVLYFAGKIISEKIKLNKVCNNLEKSKEHHQEQHKRFLKSLAKEKELSYALGHCDTLIKENADKIIKLEDALALVLSAIENLNNKKNETIVLYARNNSEDFLNKVFNDCYGTVDADEILKLERKKNNDEQHKNN